MKEKALESCAEIVSEGFTYDHTVILQCDNSNWTSCNVLYFYSIRNQLFCIHKVPSNTLECHAHKIISLI